MARGGRVLGALSARAGGRDGGDGRRLEGRAAGAVGDGGAGVGSVFLRMEDGHGC